MNQMARISESWADWAFSSSWQLAVFAGLVALAAITARRAPARFRYALWSLLLIKVFLPPTFGAVWGVGHWGVRPLWEKAKNSGAAIFPGLGRIIDNGNMMQQGVRPQSNTESSINSTTTEKIANPTNRTMNSPTIQFSSTSFSQAPTLYQPDIELLSSPPGFSWAQLLFFLWLTGFMGFLLTVGWRYMRLLRKLQGIEELDEGPLRIELERLAMQLGRPNPPELLVSPHITSPFLMGVLRPRIVLPVGLTEKLSSEEIRHILMHELTHWSRGDVAAGWVQVLAQALFWFHPVVWIANSQIRHEREAACDEEAVRACGCDPVCYGESLVKVLLAARARSVAGLGFLGIFERGTRLQKRLEDLMNRETGSRQYGWGRWAFLGVFALVFLPMAGVQSGRAEESAPFTEALRKEVTVDIDHSPKNDRLSVQYAVIAICEAAKIPYQWEKTAKQADPERRRYIEPLHIKGVPVEKALKDVLGPVGLSYGVDEKGLYLQRTIQYQPLESRDAAMMAPLPMEGGAPGLGQPPSFEGGAASGVTAMKSDAAGQQNPPSELQQRIDRAAPGEVINIPKGKYTGALNISKSVTLQGENADDTIIEYLADEPAIRIQGAENVKIESLTVRWGLKTTNTKNPDLAAVFVRDSKVNFLKCQIAPIDRPRNTPTALKVIGRSEAVFTEGFIKGFEFTVIFTDGANGAVTHSLLEGAGHCEVSIFQGSTVKVENCVLGGCEFHGVRSTGGTMEVRNNVIVNNNHAGAYLGNSSAHGVIENNLFLGNRGGIWSFAASDVTIRRNVFVDSKSEGISFHNSCNLIIEKNSFVNNPVAVVQYAKEKTMVRTGAKTSGNHYWKNAQDVRDFTKEESALSGDPLFIDPTNGNYSPNKGTPLSGPDGGLDAGLSDPDSILKVYGLWKGPRPASMR